VARVAPSLEFIAGERKTSFAWLAARAVSFESDAWRKGIALAGELLVWTDIAPHFEPDFNSWYDREHMAERVSIPGFVRARRYRSETNASNYLALYRTRSLDVFRSSDYVRAFENQSDWSKLNFQRMLSPLRRVGSVVPLCGAGMGAALTITVIDREPDEEDVQSCRDGIEPIDGFVSAYLLVPDAGLSRPLREDGNTPKTFAPMLMAEGVDRASAESASGRLATQLGVTGAANSFHLLWELSGGASD
jgi:hypothetical protein